MVDSLRGSNFGRSSLKFGLISDRQLIIMTVISFKGVDKGLRRRKGILY